MPNANFKAELKVWKDFRKEFTAKQDTSTHLLQTFSFMEDVLENQLDEEVPEGWFVSVPQEANKKIFHVRSEFETAFTACSFKEQFSYYSKAVKFLTNFDSPPKKFSDDISCEVSVQGTLFWKKGIIMTIISREHRLKLQNKN